MIGMPANASALPKLATFDFEVQHGDLVPGTPDKSALEDARRQAVAQRLRDLLAKSGRYEVLDIAPVAAKAASANLQSCGNCADDFARELGADYAVTGVVYKVSELILSIHVFVREAGTDKPIASGSVDIRGNTDESWLRGIDYLYRHLLGPRLEKSIP